MTNKTPFMGGFQSFLTDMAALLRRKAEDVGRISLFEKVSPGNVGNVFSIPPSPVINTFSLASFGTPVRVLEISGEDVLGEMICVSVQQESILNLGNGSLSDFILEGPLVGIVEYGAGAGLATFEFDIPAPVIFPGLVGYSAGVFGNLQPARAKTNAILLTLPASSLRVYVRNDAAAPYLISEEAPVSLNQTYLANSPRDATVRVHATYGRRPNQSILTRSYPICNSTLTPQLAADEFVEIQIPPFAKRVRFPRAPLQSTDLDITIIQTQLVNTAHGIYNVPINSVGPIELTPYDTILRVTNGSAATAITYLSVVFELGV